MAKHKKPNYYAVQAGRKPGIYNSWSDCEEQVSGFSNAHFKGFDKYGDALAFVGDAIASNSNATEPEIVDLTRDDTPDSPYESPSTVPVKFEDDAALMPPPASQSYFDQFPDFKPNATACFDDEFGRFASSQGIVSGSQEYRRERTKAIRDELKYHYSSQPNHVAGTPQTIPELRKGDLTEEEKLDIYQNMCREIGVEPQEGIPECRRELKKVLVNIVDYIDARRVPGQKVEIWDWDDFEEFSEYSLQGHKRIDIHIAKADGGFLSALLQKITGNGPSRKKRERMASTALIHGAKRKRVDNEGGLRGHFLKRIRVSTL